MQHLSSLIEDIEAEAPHVPFPTAQRMLQAAARDFFTRTKTWKETYEIETIAGVDRMLLPTPTGARVQEIHGVIKSGVNYDLGSSELASRKGYPMAWYDHNGLNLSPSPVMAEPLEVTVSLVPERGSDDVPDFAYERYADALIAYVLSKLFNQADRAWTDKQRGAINYQLYERAVVSAKTEAEQEHTPKRLITAYGGI